MLAVDIGNTNTRFAAFRGDAIASRLVVPTRALDVGELMRVLPSLLEEADDGEVWAASVQPRANAVVDSAAERLGLFRRFIRPASDHIIRHRLTTPATTGVDRLLSALAAGERHFPGAGGYVVVQCGSAATIDVVDGDGCFAGGYIMPGPDLWLSGLAGAAQLPDFSSEPLDWDAVTPGDNTRDAILRGLALGLPSAVSAAAMLLDAPGIVPVAITGGWGGAVAKLMDGNFVVDPDLLLHGIRIFAQRMG